jgi:serine/threonine protein kinase
LDEEIRNQSEFFSKGTEFDFNRLLPLEVACLARANKSQYIVKLIDYIPPNGKNILRETCSESCIDENLVIGIVLERDSSETSLFDYLLQNGCLKESEAKIIMKQIIDASLILLNIGILHGDLKSENILIEPKSKRIKLIDFGSSQFLESTILNNEDKDGKISSLYKYSFNKCKNQSLLTKPVRTFRGTNLYKPPEFILHHCFYPRPSTVW